jgi:hypothetical protein
MTSYPGGLSRLLGRVAEGSQTREEVVNSVADRQCEFSCRIEAEEVVDIR